MQVGSTFHIRNLSTLFRLSGPLLVVFCRQKANCMKMLCTFAFFAMNFSACSDFVENCPDECYRSDGETSIGMPWPCDSDCRKRVNGENYGPGAGCETIWINGRCLKYWEYRLVGAWMDNKCSSEWVYKYNPDGTFSRLTSDWTYKFYPSGTFAELTDEGNLMYGKWSLFKNKLTITYNETAMASFNETFTVFSLEGTRFEFADKDGIRREWTYLDTNKELQAGANFTIRGNAAINNPAIPCQIVEQLGDGMYTIDSKGNIINMEGKVVIRSAELHAGGK